MSDNYELLYQTTFLQAEILRMGVVLSFGIGLVLLALDPTPYFFVVALTFALMGVYLFVRTKALEQGGKWKRYSDVSAPSLPEIREDLE